MKTDTFAAPGGVSAPANFNLVYIWLICLVAAMGGLLFGYDWAVIGGAKPFFEPFFQLIDEWHRGWANSCALLGCLLGTLVCGGLSDRFGRKWLLVFAAVLFAASSVATGLAASFLWFVIWRMAGGVAIGMASNLSPMYIAEIAPAHLRGRLVAVNQLTITLGVLVALAVNWAIATQVHKSAGVEFIRQWNEQFGWRWMFAAVTVPSLLFLAGSLLIPESPRWLVKNGRADRARRILGRIGGTAYAAIETADIQATISRQDTQRVRFADLCEPKMFRILMIGVALAVLQQWCGINSFFNYGHEIYGKAGYDISAMLWYQVVTGLMATVATVVAMLCVDRIGRRALMLWGCAGVAVLHGLTGVNFFLDKQGLGVVATIIATIAWYGFTLAPIVWVLISEIFPNRIRGAAVSVAVAALWIACFLLTLLFPVLEKRLGLPGTFWIYGGICVAGFFFILFCVPETKNKTLEQIERELVD